VHNNSQSYIQTSVQHLPACLLAYKLKFSRDGQRPTPSFIKFINTIRYDRRV